VIRRTVVELTEVRIEPPLIDRAPACFTRLGIFMSFDTASACLRERVAEGEPVDGALLYFTAEEVALDHRRRVCHSAVYDRDGSIRGKVSGGVERPWGGRDPSMCRFKPGAIVGFVSDVYRMGVVLGLPPSPEEARRWGGVTLGDDLYLIGTLDRNESPETNDHEHVAEPELFEVQHEVPAELRAALAERHQGYAR
jgi:hypothetical protein